MCDKDGSNVHKSSAVWDKISLNCYTCTEIKVLGLEISVK